MNGAEEIKEGGTTPVRISGKFFMQQSANARERRESKPAALLAQANL
jgi:hypothetical protein